MNRFIVFFIALGAFGLGAATVAVGQIDSDLQPSYDNPFGSPFDTDLPRRDESEDIEQKFPPLSVLSKKPLRLAPPRRTIAINDATRSDSVMQRIAEDRVRLRGELKAARSVRDTLAMMRAASGLEKLRLQRVARLRAIGTLGVQKRDNVTPAPSTPSSEPASPSLPLPTRPKPAENG